MLGKSAMSICVREEAFFNKRKKYACMTNFKAKCELCNAIYMHKRNLSTHMRNKHPNVQCSRPTINCGQCESTFYHYSALRDHLTSVHNLAIYQEIHSFNTFKDFQEWKLRVEDNYKVMYRRQSVSKSRFGYRKTYYVCHRSGKDRILARGRKRRLKRQGSCKMGVACPSTIELLAKGSTEFEARIFLPHTHECSLVHLKLSYADRASVAEKLRRGLGIKAILDEIRGNARKDVNRLSLINSKDIRNIAKEFNVNYDVVVDSVGIWDDGMVLEDGPTISKPNLPDGSNTSITENDSNSEEESVIMQSSSVQGVTEIEAVDNVPDEKILRQIPRQKVRIINKGIEIKPSRNCDTSCQSANVSTNPNEDEVTVFTTLMKEVWTNLSPVLRLEAKHELLEVLNKYKTMNRKPALPLNASRSSFPSAIKATSTSNDCASIDMKSLIHLYVEQSGQGFQLVQLRLL